MNWKYKINLSPYLSELSFSDEIDREKLVKLLRRLLREANKVYDMAKMEGDEDAAYALHVWIFENTPVIEDYIKEVQKVSDEELEFIIDEIDEMLEKLYDIGDTYRIWIKS